MKTATKILSPMFILTFILNVSLSGQNCFKIGDSKETVKKIQGTPDAVRAYSSLRKETWEYGRSSIDFNRGVVEGYDNDYPNLKVCTIQSNNRSCFNIGDSKETVKKIQGTPDVVRAYSSLGKETWEYGRSSIDFNRGVVEGYDNEYASLKVCKIQANTLGCFSIGDSKESVEKVQGTPDAIRAYSSLRKETWEYGRSSIDFNRGVVEGYDNEYASLKVCNR